MNNDILKRCFYIVSLLVITFSNLSRASIQADDFFTAPDILSAQLSPNGKLVALISDVKKNQRLQLFDVSKNRKIDLLKLKDFTKFESSLRGISWIDDRHIAAQFSEVKKGVQDLLDTRNVQYLLIIKIPASKNDEAEILSVRTKGWLVNSLRNRKGEFLYAKSGAYSKVYRINVDKLSPHKKKLTKLMRKDGGQFVRSNEVASIKGFATKWFFGSDGEPKAVMNFAELGVLQLNVFGKDDEITLLNSWDFSELKKEEDEEPEKFQLIVPVAFSGEKNTFYCLDFNEEEERTVYKVNFDTKEKTLVYESNDFKIIDLIIEPESKSLVGVKVLKNAGIQNIYFSNQKNISNSPIKSSEFNSIISVNLDKNISLIYKESHSQPGQYLLTNNKSKKEVYVGSTFPALLNQLKTKLIEDSVNVEALDIPFLLTLPKKVQAKGYPLIVMPHGGPIGVFDNRYFDRSTQFLAQNGYAILRVNFRGSSGYTTELKDAGKKQWGHLMLQDIYQATKKVIKRKDINSDKVCIFGMSYGGYASTMLTIKYPELYRCAINVAGVSDVNLLLNTPNRTVAQEKWMKEHIGNTVTDYQALKEISTVYQVNRLERPILIIHGANDQIVDVEHAFRLKHMLDKYQKNYQWKIYPEGKHGYGNAAEQADLFRLVLSFIEKNS